MATSDAPLSVPNVTLAVARGAQVSSGALLFKDNFSDYATDPLVGNGTQFDTSPNYETLKAKGLNCSDSIRFTARSLSEIAGPGSEGLIAENVSQVTNPAVGVGLNDTVMRVRYAAVPLGSTTNSEFEWQLEPGFFYEAGQGTTEIWMQHDLYIPENFRLRDASEGADLSGFNINNKMATLYAGGYSGIHPTMIHGGGPSFQDVGMPYENTLYASQQMKKADANGDLLVWNGRPVDSTVPYVYGDFDIGHWLRITYRLKLETAAGANDGIHEAWVQRHVGEADTYVDKLFEEFSVNTHYDETFPFLDGGVILGYSNLGWDESTNLLVNNLIISDTQAGVDQTAITPSQPPTPQNRKTYHRSIGSNEVVEVRRPGGMVDGDTVVMIIIGGTVTTDLGDVNIINGDGGGFTKLYNSGAWDSSVRPGVVGIYVKKIADVLAEPFWYTVDFTGESGGWEIVCLSVSGRGDSGANSIVQETLTPAANTQFSPVSLDLTGVTAREGDTLLWVATHAPEAFLAQGSVTQSSLTFPEGFTPIHKLLSIGQSFGIALKTNVAAGPTGTISGTFTHTDTPDGIHHGVVIALPKEIV